MGGDLTDVTNITAIGGDITVKATTDEQDKVGGNINADGIIKGAKLVGDLESDNAFIKKAEMTEAGIKDLSGEQLNYLQGIIKGFYPAFSHKWRKQYVTSSVLIHISEVTVSLRIKLRKHGKEIIISFHISVFSGIKIKNLLFSYLYRISSPKEII